MEVVTEEHLAEYLDFRRPLNPPPEPPRDMWPIPFEYGGSAKGARISISTAKTIAAELRAAIAEAEKRELFREFKREQERSASGLAQAAKYQQEAAELRGEIATLKRALRRRKVRHGK